jgi:DNA helicase-2/ATP-dependent DNA helicase PcrA
VVDEIAYLAGLNDKQYEAATITEGPLLALAGAGTGKTKTLTSRIVHILEQELCYPRNILAVTFTNKAAKEMEARVMSMIDCSGIWLGTFHSVAAKILRRHADLVGLTSSFSIIDSDDQTKLIKSLMPKNLSKSEKNDYKIIINIISKWKDKSFLPEDVPIFEMKREHDKTARDIYFEYQKKLRDSNLVDFGDLLLYNNKIFEQFPEALKIYQELFKYILVDEYQDTNIAQYSWIKYLSAIHRNLCCVGDDDQSIYGWRGAEIGNILRFSQDFPDAKIIKLEQNYRSTKQILTAASGLIEHNSNRHGKVLWTDSKDGEKVRIINCYDDKEEARFVASRIENLKNKYKLGQIAILVRAGFQTRAFEDAFISKQLPYQIVGGLKFYERMEIKDAIAYIRLVINNNDNLAFERIVNKPKRSIGDVTIGTISEYSRIHEISMFDSVIRMLDEGIFKAKLHQTLTDFTANIKKWRALYQTSKTYDATRQILEESGYIASLIQDKTEEEQVRRDNIYELLRAIGEYNNIAEFLEHTSLVADNNDEQLNFDSIKVMTIHASKGLEFDLVFLPGWEEDIFPSPRCLTVDGKKGLEEERRIAYVGITRAKQELYISYAQRRQIYYEYNNSIPSRFLVEIPKSIVLFENSVGYYSSNISTARPNPTRKLNTTFKPGIKILHQKFGEGMVISVNGHFLEITFKESGIKTINADFVTCHEE